MTYDKLLGKTTHPTFSYVVLISEDGVDGDYYLFKFDEFDKAYEILRQEAAKDSWSYSKLCEIDFNNYDREYRLKPVFVVREGNIFYSKYEDTLLHITWHLKAGNWLNPRDDI